MEDFNLSITANFHDAWLQLPDRSFGRIMWVVAICINQKDDRERKGQIQIMPDVFRQAHCVIVWLEESAYESGRAIKAIRVIGH